MAISAGRLGWNVLLNVPFRSMAHVLLVEDYESVRMLLCEALTDLGHTADCASTKAEAEAMLAPGSHALVVCNVVLPDGSGRELAEKAAGFGMKVVLMSGHPDELQAMAVDEIAHLKKPFHLDQFRQAVQAHLGA